MVITENSLLSDEKLAARIKSKPVRIPQDARFDFEMDQFDRPQEFWRTVRSKGTIKVKNRNILYIVQTLLELMLYTTAAEYHGTTSSAFTVSQISQLMSVFSSCFQNYQYQHNNIVRIQLSPKLGGIHCGYVLVCDYENQMVYMRCSTAHLPYNIENMILDKSGVDQSIITEAITKSRALRNIYKYQSLLSKSSIRKPSKAKFNSITKKDVIKIPWSVLNPDIKLSIVDVSDDYKFEFEIYDEMASTEFWKLVGSFQDIPVQESNIEGFAKILRNLLYPAENESKKFYTFTISQGCQFLNLFRKGFYLRSIQENGKFIYIDIARCISSVRSIKLRIDYDFVGQNMIISKTSPGIPNRDFEFFLDLCGVSATTFKYR